MIVNICNGNCIISHLIRRIPHQDRQPQVCTLSHGLQYNFPYALFQSLEGWLFKDNAWWIPHTIDALTLTMACPGQGIPLSYESLFLPLYWLTCYYIIKINKPMPLNFFTRKEGGTDQETRISNSSAVVERLEEYCPTVALGWCTLQIKNDTLQFKHTQFYATGNELYKFIGRLNRHIQRESHLKISNMSRLGNTNISAILHSLIIEVPLQGYYSKNVNFCFTLKIFTIKAKYNWIFVL